jgi:hypothetical protein
MDGLRDRRSVGPARILGLSLVLVGAGYSPRAAQAAGCGRAGNMPGMAPGQMNDHGYMGHPSAMVGLVLPEFATAVPMVAEAYSFAVDIRRCSRTCRAPAAVRMGTATGTAA